MPHDSPHRVIRSVIDGLTEPADPAVLGRMGHQISFDQSCANFNTLLIGGLVLGVGGAILTARGAYRVFVAPVVNAIHAYQRTHQ